MDADKREPDWTLYQCIHELHSFHTGFLNLQRGVAQPRTLVPAGPAARAERPRSRARFERSEAGNQARGDQKKAFKGHEIELN